MDMDQHPPGWIQLSVFLTGHWVNPTSVSTSNNKKQRQHSTLNPPKSNLRKQKRSTSINFHQLSSISHHFSIIFPSFSHHFSINKSSWISGAVVPRARLLHVLRDGGVRADAVRVHQGDELAFLPRHQLGSGAIHGKMAIFFMGKWDLLRGNREVRTLELLCFLWIVDRQWYSICQW